MYSIIPLICQPGCTATGMSSVTTANNLTVCACNDDGHSLDSYQLIDYITYAWPANTEM